ncbi:MAG: hypothetical protein RBU37_28040, partial [Myxococcota bacterium]|nr:hypothetical protein [Myxococcota bacterium]
MEMQLVVMALALFLGVWAASFIMAVAALLQTRALKRQLESLRRDLASPREPRGLAPAQRVAAYAPLTHSSHPSPGAYVSPQPYAQPYAQQQPQPYVQQPATRPAQAPSPRVVALPRPTASPELLRAVVMPQGSAPSTQSSPVSLVALPQAKLATLAPQTASPTPRAVSATQEAAPAEASQPKATTAPTTVSEPTAPASLVPNTHPLALGYRPRSMTREDGVPFARFRLPSTTTAAVPQPSSASEAKAAAPSFSAAAALANAPSVSSFQRHAESLLAPGLPPSPQPLLPSAEGAAATAHDEARPDGSEPPEAPPLLLPEPAAKRRDLETFLGAEVFLKLGIAALVLGVVLFLAYTLSDLGALGKLGVGAA